MLTIKQFTLAGFMVIVTSFYLLFQFYFLQQRADTSRIILDQYRSELSGITYSLSSILRKTNDASAAKALLDRYVAKDDVIAALMLVDDSDLLLTTDPAFSTVPKSNAILNPQDKDKDPYTQLMNHAAMEGQVHFYLNNTLRHLRLLVIIDKKQVQTLFQNFTVDYLLIFGLIPIVILVLIWITTGYYLRRPLELLRQYAYYQSVVPPAFKLKELEAIRSSLNQTFDRLDQEKHELYTQARTDTLSGLANRNALEERLEWQIAEASRTKSEFALLFLDIDNFKTINDSLGHKIGDTLLQNIAKNLHEAVRGNDIIARIGGDEFVIVLSHYNTYLELIHVIERIQEHLQQEWVINTHPLNITGSIGVAFYPKDGNNIISLMKHADIAMYEAKKNGRNQYHIFTEALNNKIQHEIQLDNDMRRALKAGEYELYYQPKSDIGTGVITGAEALVRWTHPTKGIITPDAFIPLAESNGFIVELGEWVLHQAIQQQLMWKEKGICNLKISINVSTQQLLDKNFEEKFKNAVVNSGIDPGKLEVEITEYLFLENTEKNLRMLQTLHALGITIALDDFGTGYSSLSYLKAFPIDTLKIDKTFIDDFNTPSGRAFIETIMKMGQTLDLTVISEGVETAEQFAYLKAIGCHNYQGYYLSKPLNADSFSRFYLHSQKKN